MNAKAEPASKSTKNSKQARAAASKELVSINPRTQEMLDSALQAFFLLFLRATEEFVPVFGPMFDRDPRRAIGLVQEMVKLINGAISALAGHQEIEFAKVEDYRERQKLGLIQATRRLQRLRRRRAKDSRHRSSNSASI